MTEESQKIEQGPAVEYPEGYKPWYMFGKLHTVDYNDPEACRAVEPEEPVKT